MNQPTRRAAVLLASFVISVAMLTGPAAASTTSYEAAPDQGFLFTLLLFVGGPVGLFLLIWLLVVAGQLSRRPKQENDMSWFREMSEDDPDPAPRERAETATTTGPDPVAAPSGSTRVTPSG